MFFVFVTENGRAPVPHMFYTRDAAKEFAQYIEMQNPNLSAAVVGPTN